MGVTYASECHTFVAEHFTGAEIQIAKKLNGFHVSSKLAAIVKSATVLENAAKRTGNYGIENVVRGRAVIVIKNHGLCLIFVTGFFF